MNTSQIPDSERERRLNEVLLAYVEADQEGCTPDRRQLLARFPEIRHELTEFLPCATRSIAWPGHFARRH
jgi:hypothetical protein